MLENELKCRLQAPYDSKENYSSNENTTCVIQRIKRAHMQYKLTKTKGQSPVLSLGAHRAAPQPKLGVFGAHHRLADHPGRPTGPRRHRLSPLASSFLEVFLSRFRSLHLLQLG